MGLFDGNGEHPAPSRQALMGQAGIALGSVQEHMDRQSTALESILEAVDTGIEQLAVSNIAPDPALIKDFPVIGSERWIVHRAANGGKLELSSEDWEEVLPANVNRLGGSIVNYGATVVFLGLAPELDMDASAAHGMVALNALGGAWDLRLSNLTWCGSISGFSIGGAGKLAVVEV
jgi:hypothetical protein